MFWLELVFFILMLKSVCWVNLSDQMIHTVCLAIESWLQCLSLDKGPFLSVQWLWSWVIIWHQILGTYDYFDHHPMFF